MKKIIVSTVIFYFLFSLSASAQMAADAALVTVKTSFNTLFAGAKSMRWTENSRAYIATFSDGRIWKDAYFTKDGKFTGIGRYITIDEVPLLIQKKLQTEFSAYVIGELYEFDNIDKGVSYLAILNSKKNQLTIQLEQPFGEVSFFQKTGTKANKTTIVWGDDN